jgi:ATPases of the AAA+ class
VGESEKNIKDVFNRYRQCVAAGGDIPILLFNEADAIFGVRKEEAGDAVDKMENSIQNIILQEMETLEGILIATTNLEGNLDPAFERRFIFKVKFCVPEPGARRDIWRTMLPSLSGEDASVLAERYAFSGGNIENIARKGTVDYVLTGVKPTLQSLIRECDRETLHHRATARIGL